jgi:hypothetical protein
MGGAGMYGGSPYSMGNMSGSYGINAGAGFQFGIGM